MHLTCSGVLAVAGVRVVVVSAEMLICSARMELLQQRADHWRMDLNRVRVGVEMVILVFNTRAKVMIPRHRTLFWHAQNTQDHALALHWTRDMPRASQYVLRDKHRAAQQQGPIYFIP